MARRTIFIDFIVFDQELRKIELTKKHTTKKKNFLQQHCSSIKRLYCNKAQQKTIPVIKTGIYKVAQSKDGVPLPVRVMKNNLKDFLRNDLLSWARKNLNNMRIEGKEAHAEIEDMFVCTLSTPFKHTFRLNLTQKQIFQADLE